MAQELQFYGDPASDSGLTITARVYDAAGAQVGADIATAEAGTSAIYIADMPAAAAGVYGVRFFDGDDLVGSGFIAWDGAAEVDEVTLNARLTFSESKVQEIAQIHGLDPANPLVKTPTRVTVGDITQTLSGDGVNSATLTRTA